MEQVAENHGVSIGVIHALYVEKLLDPRSQVEPPKSFKAFYEFPQRCGWKVGSNYAMVSSVKSSEQHSLPVVIQAWLFFGLISTVVQKDDKPILSFGDLLSGNQLSTTYLHSAIKQWTTWCGQHPENLRIRMIRVGWVLDLARRVIQKAFAYDHGRHHDNDSSLSSPAKNELSRVGDTTPLVLMCLGETLSAAKARIVAINKLDMTGWHEEDHVGWGPPAYIFEKMKSKDWCPRAMEILRGQLSSNATMLVVAYQAYQGTSRMTFGHKECGCTKDECKIRSRDESGNFESQHSGKCNRIHCTTCGPPEADVLDVLKRDGNYIPLLVFDGDDPKRRTFKVISFDPESYDVVRFVTISHVWSDGWGNEKANRLNGCQVDFIRRQIERATRSFETPFWMDTLVVPVAKNQKESRKKAIRQIQHVFALSNDTIILDNSLTGMDREPTGPPRQP